MTEMHTLQIKRVYDDRADTDGIRILVDRLWPRGISKERAAIHEWAREIAPIAKERKAFHEGQEDWDTFKKDYIDQLDRSPVAHEFARIIHKELREGNVTLVYSSKDITHNNAVILKNWLERQPH